MKGQAQTRTVCAGGSPASFLESLEGVVEAAFIPAERTSQMEICNGRMDPGINMPFLVSMQYSAGTFISGQAHDIVTDWKGKRTRSSVLERHKSVAGCLLFNQANEHGTILLGLEKQSESKRL